LFYSLNVTESLERNEASPRKSEVVVVGSTHGRFTGAVGGSVVTGRLTFGLTFFGV
jgi:hypothetical protein